MSPDTYDGIVTMLGRVKDRVLVFDDLERSLMPAASVLGYVNTLVEQQGCRAVVIANEAEIPQAQKDAYLRTKEKVIGKTLTVTETVEEALPAFLDALDEKPRAVLDRHRILIETVHRAGGAGNLRLLRQILWDFDRLHGWLGDRAKDDELMSHFLPVFFALSYEIRRGVLAPERIGDLSRRKIVRSLSRTGEGTEEARALDEIVDRYPTIDFFDLLLDEQTWTELLGAGRNCRDAVCEQLDRSRVSTGSHEEAAWVTVWHGPLRDPCVFEAAFEKLEQELAGKTIANPGVLAHVVGLKLWLAREELSSQSVEHVVRQFEAYIDALDGADALAPWADTRTALFCEGGVYGFAVYERDTDAFRGLMARLDAALESARLRRDRSRALVLQGLRMPALRHADA